MYVSSARVCARARASGLSVRAPGRGGRGADRRRAPRQTPPRGRPAPRLQAGRACSVASAWSSSEASASSTAAGASTSSFILASSCVAVSAAPLPRPVYRPSTTVGRRVSAWSCARTRARALTPRRAPARPGARRLRVGDKPLPPARSPRTHRPRRGSAHCDGAVVRHSRRRRGPRAARGARRARRSRAGPSPADRARRAGRRRTCRGRTARAPPPRAAR